MVSSICPRSRLTSRGSKVTGMSTLSFGGSFETLFSWTLKPTDAACRGSITNETGQLPALCAFTTRISTLLSITGPKSSWYSGSHGLTTHTVHDSMLPTRTTSMFRCLVKLFCFSLLLLLFLSRIKMNIFSFFNSVKNLPIFTSHVTGRHRDPKWKLQTGYWAPSLKRTSHVATRFHHRVWYRALSLHYACIQSSGIILIP